MIRNVGIGVAPGCCYLFIIEKRGNGAKLMSDHSQATVSLFDREDTADPREDSLETWFRHRSRERAGRDFLLNDISPEKTAILNVDMQHYFMSPGFQAACPMAINIISGLNHLNREMRDRGALPVWIQTSASEEAISGWSNYAALQSPEGWSRRSEELAPGHEGFRLHPNLDVHDTDLFSVKTRFSAFIHGASDLNDQLRARGVDTVLITGVATGVCCESTARDAMMLNYRVIMVSDALAALTLESHENSLKALFGLFADVQSTQQVLEHARVQT